MLNDKVALITGASRGIGAQTARLFAKNGDAVAVNYCHSAEAAEALVREIRLFGGKAIAVRADVSDEQQVQRMVQEVTAQLGEIDLLIHNAGVAHQGLLTDMTAEEWHRVMGVHLDGAYHCCRAVVPDMVRRHSGVILTVSSMWGEVGASCEVAYSAAKAGLIGFAKALAKELGPSGIRVNGVAPGVIATDMCADLDDETMATLRDEKPLMRIGKPQDVAQALFFLASEEASFITGQILSVNGGMVI